MFLLSILSFAVILVFVICAVLFMRAFISYFGFGSSKSTDYEHINIEKDDYMNAVAEKLFTVNRDVSDRILDCPGGYVELYDKEHSLCVAEGAKLCKVGADNSLCAVYQRYTFIDFNSILGYEVVENNRIIENTTSSTVTNTTSEPSLSWTPYQDKNFKATLGGERWKSVSNTNTYTETSEMCGDLKLVLYLNYLNDPTFTIDFLPSGEELDKSDDEYSEVKSQMREIIAILKIIEQHRKNGAYGSVTKALRILALKFDNGKPCWLDSGKGSIYDFYEKYTDYLKNPNLDLTTPQLKSCIAGLRCVSP